MTGESGALTRSSRLLLQAVCERPPFHLIEDVAGIRGLRTIAAG
jgi:hypothetical protein